MEGIIRNTRTRQGGVIDRRHSDRRDFKCGLCDSSFKRKDKLREHERRMHSRPQPAPPAGGRLIKVRPRVPLSYLDRPYHCKMCQLGFKRRGMLVNHFLKCHPLVSIDSVQELNQPLPNPRRIYKCIYCHKVYQSNPRRNQHIKKVHPGKAVVNPNDAVEFAKATSVSSDSSADTGAMAGDDNSSSGTRYAARCQWCKREYMTRAKLYQHMRRYHPAGTENELRGSTETSERVLLHDDAELDCQRLNSSGSEGQALLKLSHGNAFQQQTKIPLPRASFVHTSPATHVASSSSFSSCSADTKSCSMSPWTEVGGCYAPAIMTDTVPVVASSDLLTQAMCAAIAPDIDTHNSNSAVALNLATRSIPLQIVDTSQLARSDYLEPIYINNGEGSTLSSNDLIQTVMMPSADGRECEPVSIVMPKAEEEALMTFELYSPDTGETYRLHLPPGHVLHLAPAATVITSSPSNVSAQNL
ncbi:Zinc finger C2H2-type [Trinorchestia longiramus]|nr:Zinc finger C2H2-type [Trinorchestia longiramus]